MRDKYDTIKNVIEVTSVEWFYCHPISLQKRKAAHTYRPKRVQTYHHSNRAIHLIILNGKEKKFKYLLQVQVK